METVKGHIQVSSHRLQNGCPAYFTALYPDGSTAVFGFTTAVNPDYIYPLTELTDRYGHTTQYSYTSVGGTYYLQSVSYGEGASLTFEYETVYNSATYRYAVAGKQVDNSGRLLKSIHSMESQTEIASYTLTHQYKDDVRLLTSVSCSSAMLHSHLTSAFILLRNHASIFDNAWISSASIPRRSASATANSRISSA